MFGKEKEREDYWKISKDMHAQGILTSKNSKHCTTNTIIKNCF